ncbi:hypothetical protein [Mesorhizobium sp. ORS 3428]|uniref:hypothetical protein n=1 Tax=Mesorhizobium sp. ORS 3428 TaxID=540997 RepID=UPI0009F3569D|nr:hypothetical protein [Mesorhizobium sp. ORS 3428]
MGKEENHRETGARKYPANTDPDPSDQFSQAAADNEKPHARFGLTRKKGEVEDKTHQSEGHNPPGQRGSGPPGEESSGAGPSAAKHSKRKKGA